MKKRFFLGGLVAVLALPAAIAASVFANKGFFKAHNVKADTFTFTVDTDDFADSDLTTTYQQQIEHEFDGKDAPILNYFLAKKDADDKLVLAPLGRVYNYNSMASYSGRITDILSITVDFETGTGGQLFVQGSVGGEQLEFGEKLALTSGVSMPLPTHPNYFMLSNSHAETTISRISFTYSCSAVAYSVENLGTKYTGMGADSTIYTLTRNGSNVSVAGQDGTITVSETGEFTMSLAGGQIVYTGLVTKNYKTLTFLGKSGAMAAYGPDISEMNRVYVLDDFEGYSDRGTGFTADQTSVFTATDLRGAYYVDAGSGSGATWVSGSGFKIPSTANYLNLNTSLVHGGSKAMLLQGQKAGWVRCWNSEIFNQNQHYNFGRGNRLSFWIHSGRNNPDGTGVNATNVKIKAQVYYQNFAITDTNRNSTTYGTGVSDVNDLVITSGSDWQEVVINLDPTKTVYAFNIMINNNGFATDYVFMPIDDITIYTEPVFEPTKKYEQTATKITKSYHGSVVAAGNTLSVKVGLGANGYISAYAGVNMEATSYTINGDQITINTTGSYSGQTFGSWTGTLSNNNKTITIPKENITGSIKSYVSSSEIVLTEDEVVVDGSESTSELQALMMRQYLPGSTWTDDPGNSDRLTQNAEYYIEGENSFRVRSYSGGHMRIYVTPANIANYGEFSNVAFWFYAPVGASYTIRLYGYNSATPNNTVGQGASQATEVSTTGGDDAGWHYISCGLKDGYKANFGIWVQSTSAATIVDYVTYY